MNKLLPRIELRRICINNDNKHCKYATNSIKTARYNIFSFIPLAVIYQFNSYFNIFFLFTAVLLAIPSISPMDMGSSITPFLLIIVISVVREAIEDIKKAKYDKTYNNAFSLQYDIEKDCFVAVKWKDIKVGRVIKVLKNEVIPADILLIKSSAENGFCYLQTTNLDGESALKARESLLIFHNLFKSEKELKYKVRGFFDVDEPNENIYQVEGSIQIDGEEKACFDINNILLRGGTLKNVDCIYGLVIYTGRETKLMKNIKHGSMKKSSIDIVINRIVIYIIIIAMGICTICTAFGLIFWTNNKPNYATGDMKAEYLYGANTSASNNNFSLELIKTFTAFFAIFNTLIPISLMITLEVVKGIQVFNIDKDPLLTELPGEKVKILSMKLQEDLGNVKYIFTDKTGTLTKNEMEFKACSIFARLYDYDRDNSTNDNRIRPKSIYSKDFDINNLLQAIKYDQPIAIDGLENNSPFVSNREAVVEFFLNIAINHNVLTEYDSYTGEKSYTGSNPDEIVLVQAAKEIGIEFLERAGNKTKISFFGEQITYEILHRFEFSSTRMRSSIILKDHNGTLKLYMKGADTVVLKKLDDFSKRFLYTSTKSHLDEFGKSGLRTLCYSLKELDYHTFKKWEDVYYILKDESVRNKAMLTVLDETIAELENDMLLLGVTGLEDKLQDDVKNHIEDFIDAGINVWMLTGDKLDTAESIGYSCKLFNNDTEVFKIKATNDQNETLTRVKEILNKMENYENEMLIYKIEKKKKKKNRIMPEKMILKENINLIENFREGIIKDVIEARSFEENNYPDTLNEAIPAIKGRKVFESPLNENNFTPKRKRDDVESQNNFEPMVSSSADGFFNVKRTKTNVGIYSNGKLINFKQMNNQIHAENMLFIGSELDSVNNLVTLNFRRKSSLVINPTFNKSRPTSSNPAYRFNKKKQSLKKVEEITEIDSDLDEVSIIQFMVDRNFFEDNPSPDKNNATFYNQLKISVNKNEKNEDFVHSKKDSEEECSFSNDNGNNQYNSYKIDQPIIRKDSKKSFKMESKLISVNKQQKKETKNLSLNENNLDFTNLYEDYKRKLERLETPKPLKIFNFDFRRDELEEKKLCSKNFGLIIEGSAISQCISEEISPLFFECLKNTRSVICCRCAPIQKSDVVLFMKNKTSKVTLAIGDGGNDVSMIKSANVGVGIFGKEGYQAAFNSDYAISQFRYLRRLLFVHGRYSLLRNAYYINFYFYKNLMFTLAQLWFAFFSGFSGELFWDNSYYLGYNSFLTTIPISCKMLYEQDIDITFKDDPDKMILQDLVPDLYKENRERKPFNIPKFFFVFSCGIMHSVLLYFIPFLVYKYGILDASGRCAGMWDISLTSFMSLIVLQYWIISEDTFYINSGVVIIHSIQFIVYILFFFLQNSANTGDISGIFFDLISNLQFWFAVILTVYICIIPFLIARRVEIHFSDTLVNNLRHRNFENHYDKKKYTKKLNEMQKFIRTFAKIRKISMLDDNYEPDNLADKKIKDFLDTYKSTKLQKTNRTPNLVDDKWVGKKMLNINNPPALVTNNSESNGNIKLSVNDNDMIDISPNPNIIKKKKTDNLSQGKIEQEILPIKKNAFFEKLDVKQSNSGKKVVIKKDLKNNYKEVQKKIEDSNLASLENYSDHEQNSKSKLSKEKVNDDKNNMNAPQVNEIDYMADNHPLEISDIL